MPTTKFPDAIGLPFSATRPTATRALSRQAEDQVLALFDECGPGLRRYVASFNVGAAATEDIVQDVFLALFRHLRLGRPDTNLRGWLFQVAHNRALKHRQRAAKQWALESGWDPTIGERVLDDALNPEERLALEQRRRRLASVLQRMPERDRRCVYLRAEGLCYRDIAKTLGVSLGSVAKSVVRALTQLTLVDKE